MVELKVYPSDLLILENGKSRISISNPTNQYVFYKVRVTAPEFYEIQDSNGLISPFGKAQVDIALDSSVQATYDIYRKHKFQIIGAVTTESSMSPDDFWTDEKLNSAWKKVLKFAEMKCEDAGNNITTESASTNASLNTGKTRNPESHNESIESSQKSESEKRTVQTTRQPKARKSVTVKNPFRIRTQSHQFGFSVVTLILVCMISFFLGIIIGSII